MIIADELMGEDTVVPPPPLEPPEHGTLAVTLAGRIGRLNFGPPNLSEKAEEAFGEILNTLDRHFHAYRIGRRRPFTVIP
jgi:hypothetical protein